MGTFKLKQDLFLRQIKVLLIGLGGNGCEMFRSLVDIHHSLIALGHPAGLRVTAVDGDTVSQTNLLRQSFWHNDLGQNKAKVLVNRYNLFAGLSWRAIDSHFVVEDDDLSDFDLVISCTDSGAFRYELCEWAANGDLDTLLLDLGNGVNSGLETGQFVLGHLCQDADANIRLPNVYDLFGDSLLQGDQSNEPSCSAEAALRQQSVFINRVVVNQAASLLWELLSKGSIDRHGGFVNLTKGTVSPLIIDDNTWAVFGYGNNNQEIPNKRCLQ